MQPKLFENSADEADLEKVPLYAMGDFQSRGKQLAGRQLPLDRLRGALLRASQKFGVSEPSDRAVAEGLRSLGSQIVEVPNFVAKHPFRVTVSDETAQIARTFYAGLSHAAIRPDAEQNADTR